MHIQQQLMSAVGTQRGSAAADSLCRACVSLLTVDAAAISLVFDGANAGTLGVSGPLALRYDEVQFTLGEGPCLDSVSERGPVLVDDLIGDGRWPAYGPAMIDLNIRSVYAVPVLVAGEYLGALDLFSVEPGDRDRFDLAGALAAAEIAQIPVLDLLSQDLRAALDDPDSDAWSDLTLLTRAEVSQATGMLVAQLGIDPAQALTRLRAHAWMTGRSATDVAQDIIARRLRLEA